MTKQEEISVRSSLRSCPKCGGSGEAWIQGKNSIYGYRTECSKCKGYGFIIEETKGTNKEISVEYLTARRYNAN